MQLLVPAGIPDTELALLSFRREAEPSRVRTQVLDWLRTAITVNELPPGQRLTQTTLATQLGVSRMPVRDAISDLVAEGLAEPLPSGGAVVSRLTAVDMRAVNAVREPLEVQAVKWVASTPGADLSAAEAVIDRSLAIPDGRTHELWELDREFHWAIYAATQNRFLTAALAPVWSQITRIMFAVHSIPSYSEVAWREHGEILHAIKSGEVETAMRLSRDHIRHSADGLSGAID